MKKVYMNNQHWIGIVVDFVQVCNARVQTQSIFFFWSSNLYEYHRLGMHLLANHYAGIFVFSCC